MAFKFNICEGTEKKPIKVVVYGAEGLGKTTFASKAPSALILDTENGSLRINCRRIHITSWEMLTDVIKEVIQNPDVCKTLVLDTMDKTESYAISYLCQKFHKSSIEDWAYGKGYVALQELFIEFYRLLDKVIDAGINIIVVAHGKPRKFELPDQEGAFDRWELKLNKQTSPLLKEWCDCLLFCNYKTLVMSTDTGSHKATGGKRVLYTTHHPCWDAKNRFGLAEELPLEFDSIKDLFLYEKTEVKEPCYQTLSKLLEQNGITESELQGVVARKGTYSQETPVSEYDESFITSWIIPNISKIQELVVKNRMQNN